MAIYIGTDDNDILTGGDGDDWLRGGLGDDVLQGGKGFDWADYRGAAASVMLNLSFFSTGTSTGGDGNDTLYGIEAVIGSVHNDHLSGSLDNNILEGGAGNDTLNGGLGADTLIGGLGNDSFIVDTADDRVAENPDEGIDKINSKVTYALPAHVEHLTLLGTVMIDGIGNDLANRLTGNAAVNQLTGGGSTDTLDGKAGADIMLGGSGNDGYVVDNTGDVITEYLNEGTDKVSSSVTYTLSAHVEHLTLTGALAIDGMGNDLANRITGNPADNHIDGGTGNDTLDGGAGANILIGGAGKDIFKFVTANHTDTILDFTAIDDTIQLENAVFTALTTTGTLAASQFRVGTQAVDADDRIVYNSATGTLLYDADGNGVDTALPIATVGIGLTMTAADIVVI